MTPEPGHNGGRLGVRRGTVLAGLDLLAYSGAIAAALHLRFHPDIPWSHILSYATFWPVLFAWQLFMAYCFGLYDFRHRLTLTDHGFGGAGAALAGIGGSHLFLAFMQLYALPESRVSRVVTALQMGVVFLWYIASRGGMLAILARSGYRVHLLLVGVWDEARQLAAEIRNHAPPLLHVAGIVTTDRDTPPEDPDWAGPAAKLEECARAQETTQVLLAGLELPQTEIHQLLAQCDRAGADVYLYPSLTFTTLVSNRVHSIAGVPVIALVPRAVPQPYALFKRAADMAIAATLLAAAAPLCLMAALAIRLDSRGPIFFTQARTGRHGKPFNILKFRTMTAGAEAGTGPVLATREDARITAPGRFLRKWRIDEIPQFWNVLRGDMSLVGPRPERPEFVEEFCRANPLYERRHRVRPGLTGLAQIHGRYDTGYTHKLRYDLVYLNSMSPATDLRILYATVQTVLTGRGAL